MYTDLKELKILPLTTLYIFEVLCYFKKNNIYVRRNLYMHEYHTRRKCDFHVLGCNTSLFKRSVINMGIKLYNKMPTKIKQFESFRDFKQRIKLYLLDHPFYSLNECCIFEKVTRINNKMKIGFIFYCKSYLCVITLVYSDKRSHLSSWVMILVDFVDWTLCNSL